MHEATVVCESFIGDSLFASSVCEQFKKQGMYEIVNFHIRIPQPIELLKANPYIDDVRIINSKIPSGDVYKIPASTFLEPPPLQYQKACKIKQPFNEYKVYLPSTHSEVVDEYITSIDSMKKDFIVVAWQSNWQERSFLFNKHQYWHNADVPYLGYGGMHRNIDYIISKLDNNEKLDIVLLEVGLGNGITQFDLRTSVESYTRDAFIIKHCDYFIGSEGGMSNLAAGLGTKCIITTDFIWQLYGPRGVLKQIDNPKMGPVELFPMEGHYHLDPFLTDDEIISKLNELLV